MVEEDTKCDHFWSSPPGNLSDHATTKDAPTAFAIAVKYVQKHHPEHMQAWVQFDMTTTTTFFCDERRFGFKSVGKNVCQLMRLKLSGAFFYLTVDRQYKCDKNEIKNKY